jgi:protein tyrosine phosphatase
MIVVHCMAGIGRTGTFGAVIEAVRCARKFKALSLFEIVKNMRSDRDYCIEMF